MPRGLNSVNSYIQNSQFGETAPLSVTASSSYVTFALPASAINNDCMVVNAGTKTAFINFGLASVGVTAAVPTSSSTTSGGVICAPILAGAIMTFQKNSGSTQNDTCAAICGGSDSTTLYFTSIQGS